MKKLLILAYDFPPYVSVGGLRPYAWYKYLKKHGVEPIVITRQWSNKHQNHLDYISPSEFSHTITEQDEKGSIVRTPYTPNLANRIMLKFGSSKYKLIRKAISAYYEFGQWLWPIGTKSKLYVEAHAYLSEHKVDGIIATGEPFVLFRYAALLSKKFDVPWIADYRDPWTQNANRSSTLFFKKWNAFFEKKYVTEAKVVSTVSSFFMEQIRTHLPTQKFHILPNGYDADNIANVQEITQNHQVLTLAFMGTIYNWHPLKSVLEIINTFLETEPIEFQLNFYGISNAEEVQQLIETRYRTLWKHTQIFPKMSNDKLVKKLVSCNAFLLFNDYSILGTKIYDYLALKRKILLCYGDDQEAKKLKQNHFPVQGFMSESNALQADALEYTNAGIVIKDAEHLYQVLKELKQEFVANGAISCNSENIEQFSREVQVKKLAEIVKQFEN